MSETYITYNKNYCIRYEANACLRKTLDQIQVVPSYNKVSYNFANVSYNDIILYIYIYIYIAFWFEQFILFPIDANYRGISDVVKFGHIVCYYRLYNSFIMSILIYFVFSILIIFYLEIRIFVHVIIIYHNMVLLHVYYAIESRRQWNRIWTDDIAHCSTWFAILF